MLAPAQEQNTTHSSLTSQDERQAPRSPQRFSRSRYRTAAWLRACRAKDVHRATWWEALRLCPLLLWGRGGELLCQSLHLPLGSPTLIYCRLCSTASPSRGVTNLNPHWNTYCSELFSATMMFQVSHESLDLHYIQPGMATC